MFGVWLNSATVIAGGLLGTFLRGGIKDSIRKTINAGVALSVLLIGISGALKTQNTLIMILSIVIGGFLGELLKIEDHLDRMGAWAQQKFAKNDTGFAAGFISTTLLFCVGAMAVVGPLQAGLSNDQTMLIAKSTLDGVSSIIFASTFGIGVVFSSIPLLIYQGGIALLSGVLAPILSDAMITEMGAVGSLLIVGISINLLEMSKDRIRIGNMLPAIFLPCALLPLADWISKLL